MTYYDDDDDDWFNDVTDDHDDHDVLSSLDNYPHYDINDVTYWRIPSGYVNWTRVNALIADGF
jgi:hypothetical protein